MDRLMIVAPLKPGAHEAAEALLESGPPFDLAELGFRRHAVYLTATEVVFLFEAPEVEWIVDDMVDDLVLGRTLEPWRELVEGPPRLAHERFYWELDQSANAGASAREGR
jgi:hypothetical protein